MWKQCMEKVTCFGRSQNALIDHRQKRNYTNMPQTLWKCQNKANHFVVYYTLRPCSEQKEWETLRKQQIKPLSELARSFKHPLPISSAVKICDFTTNKSNKVQPTYTRAVLQINVVWDTAWAWWNSTRINSTITHLEGAQAWHKSNIRTAACLCHPKRYTVKSLYTGYKGKLLRTMRNKRHMWRQW